MYLAMHSFDMIAPHRPSINPGIFHSQAAALVARKWLIEGSVFDVYPFGMFCECRIIGISAIAEKAS
jgi:hypothetical protein